MTVIIEEVVTFEMTLERLRVIVGTEFLDSLVPSLFRRKGCQKTARNFVDSVTLAFFNERKKAGKILL